MMSSSPAAIPNWPVIEINTDCPARLAATPKLPCKLCSDYPEGLHWLKLELPSVKDFSVFRWFISMVLLPHRRVAQRQDPHTGKCLDIQFYDIFLAGQQLPADSDRKVATGAPDQFTGSRLSLWPNFWRGFSPKSWPPPPDPSLPPPPPTLRRFGGATIQGTTTTQLCLPNTDKDWWTGLVDLNFSPVRVLQGDASTCLRGNLRRAIQADGYTTQINLKNTV